MVYKDHTPLTPLDSLQTSNKIQTNQSPLSRDFFKRRQSDSRYNKTKSSMEKKRLSMTPLA